MASEPPLRGTEAYFLAFMAGQLPEDETASVMMSPKFWDFLASTLPHHVREWLADEMVRGTLDEGAADPERGRVSEKVLEVAKAFAGGELGLRERDAEFQALYAGVAEGGKFGFLRDWFCSPDEGGETGGGWEEAGKESGRNEAEDMTVWEWTESDEEAEQWLFERDLRTAWGGAWKGDGTSSAAVGKVLEWTESDSEAEQEEAQRQVR